jgi:hypothetical protein
MRWKVKASVRGSARQAIVTKYYGPTNTRGARIVARAQAGRASVGWGHADSIDVNHAGAACVLADKFGWSGEWVHGVLPDGRHVFVWTK